MIRSPMYASTATNRDTIFAVRLAARLIENQSREDFNEYKPLFRYLSTTTNLGITLEVRTPKL